MNANMSGVWDIQNVKICMDQWLSGLSSLMDNALTTEPTGTGDSSLSMNIRIGMQDVHPVNEFQIG